MTERYLSPYVNFQGRAREAMEHYQKVLGGKLDLRTVNEQGVATPAGPGDSISYARLDADGAIIIGTDGHPKYPAKAGENVAIAVGGTDKDRLTKIYHGLAEGGTAKQPPSPTPWGADVGYLLDKFGINWIVSIDKA